MRLAGNAGLGAQQMMIEDRPVPTPRTRRRPGMVRLHGAVRRAPLAADYIAIAQQLHTVFLSGVPRFDGSNDDAARRFIVLIDELYDRRVRLVVSAAAEPVQLYAGERLRGQFERTASRLMEMRTAGYLGAPGGAVTAQRVHAEDRQRRPDAAEGHLARAAEGFVEYPDAQQQRHRRRDVLRQPQREHAHALRAEGEQRQRHGGDGPAGDQQRIVAPVAVAEDALPGESRTTRGRSRPERTSRRFPPRGRGSNQRARACGSARRCRMKWPASARSRADASAARP